MPFMRSLIRLHAQRQAVISTGERTLRRMCHRTSSGKVFMAV